jgi:hypothetical protein
MKRLFTGGPAAFRDTVSQIDSAAPPEGNVTFLFDVLHRRCGATFRAGERYRPDKSEAVREFCRAHSPR